MMAPNFSEDEIDDLLYLARVGEKDEFVTLTKELCERENCTVTDLLETASENETSGNGVLHMAAANGHDQILTFILESLSKPSPQNPSMLAILNAQNKSGNTALHWAALNGHLESVKHLLEYGADPTITNQRGHDAVYEAELNDKKEVVEWVLKESEGLEEGIAGDAEEGEAAEVSMEMDAEESSSERENIPTILEDTMNRMDVKEDSSPVKS